MKRTLFFLSIAVSTFCWSAHVSAYKGRESPLPNHQMRGTKNANSRNRLKTIRRRGQAGKGGNTNNRVNNTNTGYGTSTGKGVNTANIFRDPWATTNSTETDDLDLLDIEDTSPAGAPVEAIVDLPTTPPTAIPTGSPVHAPTMIPSSRPTGSPVLAPTIMPSSRPAPSPTSAPSAFPTPASVPPTTAPSTGPAADRDVDLFELSDFVSLPQCETRFGVFGSLEGESFTIEFGYELETDPQKLDDDVLLALRDKVLPLLETKMNDLILPLVFPHLCMVLEMVQQEEIQYHLVEGISARPDDEPIVNGDGTTMSCSNLSVSDSNCHVVQGGVTIYGPFETSYNMDVSARVLNALEAVMQQDVESLVSVHPSIRRVSYVNLDDDDDDSVQASSTGTTDQGNSNAENSPVMPIVLAGAGGLCVAALAWAYIRSRDKNGNNTSLVADTTEMLSGAPATPQSRNDAAVYSA